MPNNLPLPQVVANPEGPLAKVYLGAFCASTVAAISIMGGTFAVLPAYEADLFGPKYVQAIHGRFLLAATISTVLGPTLLLRLRRASERSAIQGNRQRKCFPRHSNNSLRYRFPQSSITDLPPQLEQLVFFLWPLSLCSSKLCRCLCS